MDKLIVTMSKLMEVCQEARTPLLTLPQIAVVGGQSAGKSSVLEAFVGKSFLPSGEGIVTRRPLKLTMINDPTDSSPDGVATFSERPGETFTDFEDIKRVITEETEKEVGSRRVSDKPINLTIRSKSVPNLILIDLPGRVTVAAQGQDARTPQLIDSMIAKFIDNPKTIILVVTEADRDIENSAGIEYAQQFDELRDRTVCVATKMDRANTPALKKNVVDTLSGKVHKLKLGYFGVRLRGPREVQAGMTIMECRELERKFFAAEFPTIAKQCGMDALSEYLSSLLLSKLAAELPDLESQLQGQAMQVQTELNALGSDADIQTDVQRSTLLNEFIRLFRENYHTLLTSYDGSGINLTAINRNTSSSSSSSSSAPSSYGGQSALAASMYSGRKAQTNSKPARVSGGARINKTFAVDFPQAVQRLQIERMEPAQLRTFMHNTEGLTSSLYVPERCFFQLVRQQIDYLKSTVDAAVDACHGICNDLIRQALNQVSGLHRFPSLRVKLQQETQILIGQWRAITLAECQSYLDAEKSYINTKNPRFRPAECLMRVQSEKQQATAPPTLQQPPPVQTQKPKPAGSFGGFGFPAPAPKTPQAQPPQPQPQPQPKPETANHLDLSDTDKEKLVYLLVENYFDIVKRNILDIVPKTITHLLVEYSDKNFITELQNRFRTQELVDTFVVEDPTVQAKRQALNAKKQSVEKARTILDELRS